MGVISGFSLSEFSDVLALRDTAGNPYVLIGGQAVNYWAERYLPTEQELASLMPFASMDIDFKGNREDVLHIARQLGLQPVFPPKVALTALAGVVPLRMRNLSTAVEVVRRLPGVPTKKETPAIQAEWNGTKIRVLDPISLLACKLELAATVSQRGRQDVTHLRILIPCVRAFLAELLNEVELRRLSSRAWLKIAGQVQKLLRSQRARRIQKSHHLDWLGIMPHGALLRSRDPKIVHFLEQVPAQGKRAVPPSQRAV